MCWQWSGYVCPLSWDEVAKKCLWCLSLTKCYNAKHLDQSSQMKIPHFFVKKCFESFQLPPQPSNYPTNQLTKYSLNHLFHHPTIQIFNHPHQPSVHSAFPPSNQFTILVSIFQPSQHNPLSRFSWEIKSVDDLFGVNNSLSRFLWLSLNQIVSLLDLSKSDNFIICIL